MGSDPLTGLYYSTGYTPSDVVRLPAALEILFTRQVTSTTLMHTIQYSSTTRCAEVDSASPLAGPMKWVSCTNHAAATQVQAGRSDHEAMSKAWLVG
jgi:hypothetical protein